MKLVIGIVRPEKTNDVLEALYRAEVRGISLSRVEGHGGELDRVETYRGTTVKIGMSDKVRFEIAVSDSFVQQTIDALAEGCSSLFLTLASERVVLGGGVINQRHWLVEEIAFQTARKLGGYLPYIGDRAPIVAARLGADAGQRGALLLAEKALQSQA